MAHSVVALLAVELQIRGCNTVTEQKVREIFASFISGENILFEGWSISIDDFLYSPVTRFCEASEHPTKEELHHIDGGYKGYANLIDRGVYS